jgi:hypothetical protein
MFKIHFIIILTFCLISASFKARSGHFCKISQKTCKGKYGYSYKFRESCESEKCSGRLGKQCTKEYCSIKEENCILFYLQLDIKLASIQNLIDRIRDCPDNFKFHSKNVCLNEDNCKIRDLMNRKAKNIRCLCPKSNSYECGAHLCTVDKRTCEIQKNLKIPMKFNHCLNGNKTFSNRLFETLYSVPF